jgi:uncharacterized protein YkwD
LGLFKIRDLFRFRPYPKRQTPLTAAYAKPVARLEGRSAAEVRYIVSRISFSILLTLSFLAAAALGQINSGKQQAILVDEFGTIRTAKGRAVSAAARPAVERPTASVQAVERGAFELMNTERLSKGLSALVWSDRIADLARLHSQNMAVYDFFNHRGIDGQTVDGRADLFGLGDWRAIGENIAFTRGFDAPQNVAFENWMKSPPHRRNVLNPQWKESAIGVAVKPDGTHYFTQVFMVRN